MKIFDQYVDAVASKFSNPSPAMGAYIAGLRNIESESDLDVDIQIATRQARWEALSDEEQIACQVIAATL